jgi:hypothetical protein
MLMILMIFMILMIMSWSIFMHRGTFSDLCFGGWNFLTSPVATATLYRLNGSGFECRWGQGIFSLLHTRPDLPRGPSGPLYNGYQGSLPGIKRPGTGGGHSPHLVPRLKIGCAVTLHPLCASDDMLRSDLYLFYFYPHSPIKHKFRYSIWLDHNSFFQIVPQFIIS